MSDENKKNLESPTKKDVEMQIIDVLKTVYDPEIPVDIYEMGLVYEINIDDDFNAEIVMTLTSPSCPVAESLPEEVKQKVGTMWSVKSAEVKLVWEPPWTKEMMSEEALLELGFM
ncbi:MAG: FeS assembly SUF system protein [Flavobacteriales bacterium CG18_big_fil_WC_8_21_14_2_50_32_9]|nr:MAG: FeS assembly SUF system protein [Flavobacteriales bacterium CG18_big_fil_WC_8_21_14_2_50_32_9]PIZ06470.1 MAG: FeS assembly SUF system protein [Flavobacteriales bacterium CG_4_10_14_0_8_um_filter_32_5]